MGTIKKIFLLSMSFILFSCSSDNDNENNKLDSLEQTIWKGEFIQEKNGEQIRKGNVGIEFTTSRFGYLSLVLENKFEEDTHIDFRYTIDQKILKIETGNDSFMGNWFVVSNKKNTLILQKGIGSQGTEKSTMILKKAI